MHGLQEEEGSPVQGEGGGPGRREPERTFAVGGRKNRGWERRGIGKVAGVLRSAGEEGMIRIGERWSGTGGELGIALPTWGRIPLDAGKRLWGDAVEAGLGLYAVGGYAAGKEFRLPASAECRP